jgi:NAD-dependent SIR2 family protein deacetylase
LDDRDTISANIETMTFLDSQLQEATEIIRQADTVFILAGAGLSAEVGIPTYWTSEEAVYGGDKTEHGYTPLQHADASLWMQDTVSQIEYYAAKQEQFAAIDFSASIYGTLLEKVQDKNYFCVTSNVDSGFYRAGFDEKRLFEVHGSHRACQCIMDATHGIFPTVAGGTRTCLVCAMPTRPNVLFFNDHDFNPEVLYGQQARYNHFLDTSEKGRVAILELGVGDTVPRVRQIGNRLYRDYMTADYIHVNLEPEPEFLFGESCSFENKEQWLQMRASAFIQAL